MPLVLRKECRKRRERYTGTLRALLDCRPTLQTARVESPRPSIRHDTVLAGDIIGGGSVRSLYPLLWGEVGVLRIANMKPANHGSVIPDRCAVGS